MTETYQTPAKAPLGVGSIVSEAFSIGFGNFGRVLAIAVVSSFATTVVET